MRGYVPWKDWLLYGGLAAVAIVSAGVAALTPQEWSTGKILVLVLVPVAFLVVSAIVLVGKYRSRPDFISKHGIAVWTGGVPLDKAQFERLTYVFIRMLPSLVKSHLSPTDVECSDISENNLRGMLNGARVEWRRKPITIFSRWGWVVKDKEGLQQGRSVMVHWTESLISSAYYHELMHMVDEIVLHRGVDYTHKDVKWWGLVTNLKRAAAVDEVNR
jgi:hypothetical protein